jgi:hypothetical protein
MAKNIVEKDPTLFSISKRPTHITFSSMRAFKEEKK